MKTSSTDEITIEIDILSSAEALAQQLQKIATEFKDLLEAVKELRVKNGIKASYDLYEPFPRISSEVSTAIYTLDTKARKLCDTYVTTIMSASTTLFANRATIQETDSKIRLIMDSMSTMSKLQGEQRLSYWRIAKLSQIIYNNIHNSEDVETFISSLRPTDTQSFRACDYRAIIHELLTLAHNTYKDNIKLLMLVKTPDLAAHYHAFVGAYDSGVHIINDSALTKADYSRVLIIKASEFTQPFSETLFYSLPQTPQDKWDVSRKALLSSLVSSNLQKLIPNTPNFINYLYEYHNDIFKQLYLVGQIAQDDGLSFKTLFFATSADEVKWGRASKMRMFRDLATDLINPDNPSIALDRFAGLDLLAKRPIATLDDFITCFAKGATIETKSDDTTCNKIVKLLVTNIQNGHTTISKLLGLGIQDENFLTILLAAAIQNNNQNDIAQIFQQPVLRTSLPTITHNELIKSLSFTQYKELLKPLIPTTQDTLINLLTPDQKDKLITRLPINILTQTQKDALIVALSIKKKLTSEQKDAQLNSLTWGQKTQLVKSLPWAQQEELVKTLTLINQDQLIDLLTSAQKDRLIESLTPAQKVELSKSIALIKQAALIQSPYIIDMAAQYANSETLDLFINRQIKFDKVDAFKVYQREPELIMKMVNKGLNLNVLSTSIYYSKEHLVEQALQEGNVKSETILRILLESPNLQLTHKTRSTKLLLDFMKKIEALLSTDRDVLSLLNQPAAKVTSSSDSIMDAELPGIMDAYIECIKTVIILPKASKPATSDSMVPYTESTSQWTGGWSLSTSFLGGGFFGRTSNAKVPQIEAAPPVPQAEIRKTYLSEFLDWQRAVPIILSKSLNSYPDNDKLLVGFFFNSGLYKKLGTHVYCSVIKILSKQNQEELLKALMDKWFFEDAAELAMQELALDLKKAFSGVDPNVMQGVMTFRNKIETTEHGTKEAGAFIVFLANGKPIDIASGRQALSVEATKELYHNIAQQKYIASGGSDVDLSSSRHNDQSQALPSSQHNSEESKALPAPQLPTQSETKSSQYTARLTYEQKAYNHNDINIPDILFSAQQSLRSYEAIRYFVGIANVKLPPFSAEVKGSVDLVLGLVTIALTAPTVMSVSGQIIASASYYGGMKVHDYINQLTDINAPKSFNEILVSCGKTVGIYAASNIAYGPVFMTYGAISGVSHCLQQNDLFIESPHQADMRIAADAVVALITVASFLKPGGTMVTHGFGNPLFKALALVQNVVMTDITMKTMSSLYNHIAIMSDNNIVTMSGLSSDHEHHSHDL